MFKKLLVLFVVLFAATSWASAQGGSVSGTVTDSRTGEPLTGVNVFIQELTRGMSTNIDGEYSIAQVPPGSYTLVATYIGYRRFSTQIEIGTTTIVRDISLQEDILGLEEVVVTGVGRGTETTKLGFSVSRIGERDLQEVPAANIGSAIRAKTPGVTIVNASGDPSVPAAIRLRGSTTINGSQSPLIIVDGVITSGTIQDINMQDVESIEIIKGAAASSIYGSLAGNGVIQILTKRTADTIDKPRVLVRYEYGQSTLGKEYPLTNKHPWRMDGAFAPVIENGRVTSWPGYRVEDVDANGVARFTNEFPVIFDNMNAIFTGQPYLSKFVQVSGSSDAFNYMGSFEGLDQGGVVEGLQNYERNSFRFNADYSQGDRFKLSFSGSYIKTEHPRIAEQGQGSNYFYSALSAARFLDFTEKNPDGSFSNNPTGYAIAGQNVQNPLYVAQFSERIRSRDRYIAGITASFELTDWLSVHGRQSIDYFFNIDQDHNPVGYQTPLPSQVLNNGYERRIVQRQNTAISELWLESVNSYGDFNFNTILKYLYEDRFYEFVDASGFEYATAGVRRLGFTNPANYSIDSQETSEKAENIIFNTDVDYKDKIIVGAMLRRDGSSSFGEDERYQWYYRGSLAYRITQDFAINNVQELKVRASYGVSGQRPPFSAQFETYSVQGTSLVPLILGNTEIKPSVVAELELGIDMAFLNRFSFVFNYAVTEVTNDYLLTPLAGTSPFASQWQNVGAIENETVELGLNGVLINTRDMNLSFNLSFDRTTQVVTDLGPVPAFTRTGSGAAIALFRFEEGVPYGTFYGNKLITSLNQLSVNESGNVMNSALAHPGETFTPSDFVVNRMGYVVVADKRDTPQERPMYLWDEETNGKKVTTIGDANPDFKMGFSTNFSFKGFGAFMVWEYVHGGDVYNYSRQLLYDRYAHKDLEDYTSRGHDYRYVIQGAHSLYNGAQPSSHFVEDATFLKLRELALSYTINNRQLGTVGSYIQDVRVSLVGRNLLTISNYSGFDPEVALRQNSTNFRLDEYAYPNFRTFSGSIQVRI